MNGEIGAYVFVECRNDPLKVAKETLTIAGVKQAHALFGPLDAIAFVVAENLAEMEKIVMKIQKIEGVKNTDTRIARIH